MKIWHTPLEPGCRTSMFHDQVWNTSYIVSEPGKIWHIPPLMYELVVRHNRWISLEPAEAEPTLSEP